MRQTSKPKKVNRIGLGVGIFLLLVLGFYLFIALYYTKGFSFCTFINGRYCTGMSVEEANDLLKSDYTYPGFTLVRGSEVVGEFREIQKEQVDFRNGLNQILATQNPFTWPLNLVHLSGSGFGPREIKPDITYRNEDIEKWYYSLPYVQQENTGEHVVRLHYSDEAGYTLEDTKYSTLMVEEALA